MIKFLDAWGPFAHGLDPAERLARARLLRGLAHVLLGERATALKACLLEAESNDPATPLWLAWALDEIDDLAALDRRRLLATYGAVSCPQWSA